VQQNQSVQPEVMFHQYQFMDRLQHAIGLQTRVLADLAIRLEAAQKALMACELRVSSLRKVVEVRRRDLALGQMRREQKETDERAAIQFFRRSFGLTFQEA
jgi:flagellar FliJ protein